MLSRKNRISRKDFDTIFAKAKWFNSGVLNSKIIRLRSGDLALAPSSRSATQPRRQDKGTYPQFSCVIAKKTLAKAVDRHLAKRRVYNAIQKLLPRINPQTQGIIFVQTKGVVPKYKEIEGAVEDVLRQAKCFV